MKEKEIGMYYLMNEDGEIIREIPSSSAERLVNNDIIIRRDSPEGNDPIEKIKYSYLKFNKIVSIELYKECPQFFMLIPFINFKENALRFSNGVYITPTNFARHLGFSETYMIRTFNKLKKLKIIAKMKKDGKYIYVVNPYIVMCGSGVRKSTKDCFEKTDWELLAERKGKNK